MLRSWLFVPGDSERKQARAAECPADALILDLEDSVAPARLAVARGMVRAFLAARDRGKAPEVWVRVNPLSSGELDADLAAVMAGAPAGLVVPKISSAAELRELDTRIATLERRHGLEPGSTRLLAIATETPQAIFSLGEYRQAGARLAGLTWGAEDLSAALGASSKYEEDGTLTFTFRLARSLCLLAAAAAGVQAIDGVFVDFRDTRGLEREAAGARRDGFTGKLAIHPDQVPAINAAFTPSAAEIEHARKVVAAFEQDPDAGVASVDGRMVDRPHLVQARRVLALAERAGHEG